MNAIGQTVSPDTLQHWRGELRTGDRLCERYRVVEVLRRNSAGTLIEAIDELRFALPGANKRVAIHAVDARLAQDHEFLRRMEKLQKLSHPAVARLLDVETDSGVLLLVMELLSGPSLHDLLACNGSKMLHLAATRSALRNMARVLIQAHALGLAHGDVSARNMFLTHTGEFRLQGFEIQDVSRPADPAADSAAFLALACRLLTDAHGSRHPPPGLTREQWHALRQQGDVLAAFASDAPYGFLRPVPASDATRRWGVAAVIAAVLGIGASIYAARRSEPPRIEVTATTAPTLGETTGSR